MRAPSLAWMLLASVLVLGACGEGSSGAAVGATEGPAPGTAAMAARLLAKAAATDPMGNMYLNEQRLERVLADVKAAGGVESAPFGLRARLAEELLLSGRSAEALEAFDSMAAQLDAMGKRANPQARQGLRRMLSLACLRLGEQRNCLAHHNPDSCLMPMAGGGVHVEPEGSRRAAALLLESLADDPQDWESRWLLNLALMTLGEWPDGVPDAYLLPPDVFASDYDLPRFPDVAAQVGVAAVGLAGGVVMDDLDGDGRLDLLVSSWGLDDPLQLFLNTGNGAFVERSAAEAGLAGLTGGLNLLQADYDNDGDIDVLVLRGAWFERAGDWPNSLLQNDGSGRFRDVTEAAGLLSDHPTQTAAFGDYDGDGWLDLFVGNETGPEEVHPSQLFHNRGDGGFDDVTERCGLKLEHYVKGVVWGDVDNDGDPDLYVSRIDGKNLLLRNDGAADGSRRAPSDGPPVRRPAAAPVPWSFTDVAEQAGVTEPKRSFPTWFFDYDNDGHLDLFVSGFRYGSAGWVARDVLGQDSKGIEAKLYRNRGDGSFEDVSASAGLDKVLLTMGSNIGDLDNDGFMDAFCATGEPDYAALYPNRAFRNDGAGRFQDVTTAGGFGHVQKGHGVAFGDLDNDGDQDLYVVLGGAYSGDVFANALYLNPTLGQRWVTLRLQGVQANRAAIGARVEALVASDAGPRSVHALVGSGGSFGGNSLQLELGLGDARSLTLLTVTWPGSGRVQRWQDLPLDSVLQLVEGQAEARVLPNAPLSLGR